MLKIKNFRIGNRGGNIVTDDPNPRFTYYAESDGENIFLEKAVINCNGETFDALAQTGVRYEGKTLTPHTEYVATLSVEDNRGEKAESTLCFTTGKLGESWRAKWITDGEYRFTEKKTSPVPMLFSKSFKTKGKVKKAYIHATALGIYELEINGKKIGEDFFTPGFTSYKSYLQYQTYDIAPYFKEENVLRVRVCGGWAVGAFVFSRVNRVTAPRQALLAEVHIVYENGEEEVFGTDESWGVSLDGRLRFSEFYDGETYDARIDEDSLSYRASSIEKVKISPGIEADYGEPVRAHEVFIPVAREKKNEETIYDFGQNLAGVVRIRLRGYAGQKIVVRHAEILKRDGTLNTAFLRSAKATLTYICREGEQEYMPQTTYMGYRYVSVSGIPAEDILSIESVALYSDVETTGEFSCSDERINRLQENILWSGKSNFVDIPTDCPQRDERMGWTGDIAVFAATAFDNFGMSRFLDKWLRDMRAEQTRGGGIPNTIPVQGYGFPVTMPKKAIAFWGDACIYVPWAEYLACGDEEVLRENYPMMKKYIKACRFWAGLFSFGKNRYIWNDLPVLQFGDWVAADVDKMSEWQRRSKWTATAALYYSAALLSKIAKILKKDEDAEKYAALSEKVADAYMSVLTDGNGKLKEEFQTAYVLPLHFKMFPETTRVAAAENLAALVRKNDYRIGTGFPGTPYILFALADNGQEETAFKMLTNESCPSWLYEVKVGATTVWERWDGLDENGECPIGDDGTGGMISYNHYGSGAVGDFFYKRILGIEPVTAGYREFVIKPRLGPLTRANGKIRTPYGDIEVLATAKDEEFILDVRIPVGTRAEIVLPDGNKKQCASGAYSFVVRRERT